MTQLETADWPIITQDPEIQHPQPDTTWFHGTKAHPFDRPKPATCFTPYRIIAQHFANSGSYQRTDHQDGPPRILTARIELPDGAPLWPMSDLFGQYLNMVDTTRPDTPEQHRQNVRYQHMARAEYHEAAEALTRHLGYEAYWADLFGRSKDSCLVVLNPDLVTITSHHFAETG